MTRVFLVDDHEIVRIGVREMLEHHSDLNVVGEAGSVRDTLTIISPEDVDVAVVDVRLPDGNGVELCRELRSQNPNLNFIILTSYDDNKALLDAVMAGANGFVLKRVLGDDLAAAIRKASTGASLLKPREKSAVLKRLTNAKNDPLAGLSPQERRVFHLIGDGLTNRQIGERIDLSDKTVKNYVSHLLTKLDVQRRTQVAVMAAQQNLCQHGSRV